MTPTEWADLMRRCVPVTVTLDPADVVAIHEAAEAERAEAAEYLTRLVLFDPVAEMRDIARRRAT
jgi:hypothetical protein